MATTLEPAEQALVEYALARGFLTRAQVDEALAVLDASAARGLPVRLLQILRERYLGPEGLSELTAFYEARRGSSSAGPESVTLLNEGSSVGAESVTHLAEAPPPPLRAASGPGEARRIGPYEVVREIARGGMGVVYVARRAGQQEKLALKLLLNSEQAEPKDIERFQVEAAAAGKLSHPNIVKIQDVGRDARGCHYMVMDYVEGDSLQGLLRRQGPMDSRGAAEMAIKLARALQHAHDQRVLHRDMKPANVLVREGEPLIADFGLAKEQGADGKSLTVTGEVMGTPAYMPPEQAEGARKEIDARSDQYSLGATLYQMLTGLPPFQGQSPINIVMAVLTKPPVSLRKRRPDLDPELEAIVLKTLSKEREERYPDCEALARALEEWLGGGEAKKGTKGALLALVAVALLAVGGAFAFAAGPRPEETTAASAANSPLVASLLPTATPAESASPTVTRAESAPPATPDPIAAYTPPPLEALFDESRLERVVLLNAHSLEDGSLEHLEVGQPWLVTPTAEGLRFRGNRNASPRLRFPLRSLSSSNQPFMLRLKFRVTHLGRELRFGVGLCSRDRTRPRLLAVALANGTTKRPDFCGLRLRYYPRLPFSKGGYQELFSPRLEGFRPPEDLTTIEIRADEGRLEFTTLVGDQLLDRTRVLRHRPDGFQGGDLDLEVGFVQSNTVHERRIKGFSRQLNSGEALMVSCELLAEPGTFAPVPAQKLPWRLLGLAGRALARGDLPRARQLLADPLLASEVATEHRVRVRVGVLRGLTALAGGDRPQAIKELRELDAGEQAWFPSVGTRADDKERFMSGMGSSFWGLRSADLPLVDTKLRSLFVEAYRAHVLEPGTDPEAFAQAQGRFFELDPETLSALSAACRSARAGDTAPFASLVRARVAKSLRREEPWGLRHHLSSWLALNLSLAEPATDSPRDTVAGYLWNRAGAHSLAWPLLEPSLESEDPFQRWIAVNFGADALYRQGDYARALELWEEIEAEALEGPLSLPEGGVDTGVSESLLAPFKHARRMVESR